MERQLDNYLKTALVRLEKAYEELRKARGYDRQSETVKTLAELVKEQIHDENPRDAARPTG